MSIDDSIEAVEQAFRDLGIREPTKRPQDAVLQPARLRALLHVLKHGWLSAYTAISSYITPVWLASEAHVFAREGLAVELIYVAGGPTAVQALLSGKRGLFPITQRARR